MGVKLMANFIENEEINTITAIDGNIVIETHSRGPFTIPISEDSSSSDWTWPSDVTQKFNEYKTAANVKKFITDLPPQVVIEE